MTKRWIGKVCRTEGTPPGLGARTGDCRPCACDRAGCVAELEAGVPTVSVLLGETTLVKVRVGKKIAYLTQYETHRLIAQLAETLADFDVSDGQ